MYKSHLFWKIVTFLTLWLHTHKYSLLVSTKLWTITNIVFWLAVELWYIFIFCGDASTWMKKTVEKKLSSFIKFYFKFVQYLVNTETIRPLILVDSSSSRSLWRLLVSTAPQATKMSSMSDAMPCNSLCTYNMRFVFDQYFWLELLQENVLEKQFKHGFQKQPFVGRVRQGSCHKGKLLGDYSWPVLQLITLI